MKQNKGDNSKNKSTPTSPELRLRVLSPPKIPSKNLQADHLKHEKIKIYTESESHDEESMLMEEEDLFETLKENSESKQNKSNSEIGNPIKWIGGIANGGTGSREANQNLLRREPEPIQNVENLNDRNDRFNKDEERFGDFINPNPTQKDLNSSPNKQRTRKFSRFKLNISKKTVQSNASSENLKFSDGLSTPNTNWRLKFNSDYQYNSNDSEFAEGFNTEERLKEPGLGIMQRKILTEEEQNLIVKSFQNTRSRNESLPQTHRDSPQAEEVDVFFQNNKSGEELWNFDSETKDRKSTV